MLTSIPVALFMAVAVLMLVVQVDVMFPKIYWGALHNNLFLLLSLLVYQPGFCSSSIQHGHLFHKRPSSRCRNFFFFFLFFYFVISVNYLTWHSWQTHSTVLQTQLLTKRLPLHWCGAAPAASTSRCITAPQNLIRRLCEPDGGGNAQANWLI